MRHRSAYLEYQQQYNRPFYKKKLRRSKKLQYLSYRKHKQYFLDSTFKLSCINQVLKKMYFKNVKNLLIERPNVLSFPNEF